MAKDHLEKVLEHITRDRRGFFKTMLVGTAIALPLMTVEAVAQKAGEDPGAGGTCDPGLVVSKKTGKCMVRRRRKKMPASNP
ncbi:MAG: hypothetical protein ACREFW_06150 [Rhizomicrobium sp.]